MSFQLIARATVDLTWRVQHLYNCNHVYNWKRQPEVIVRSSFLTVEHIPKGRYLRFSVRIATASSAPHILHRRLLIAAQIAREHAGNSGLSSFARKRKGYWCAYRTSGCSSVLDRTISGPCATCLIARERAASGNEGGEVGPSWIICKS